jgi:hypothetical protein
MAASVPVHKKTEVDDEIKSENDDMWLAAGIIVFGRH